MSVLKLVFVFIGLSCFNVEAQDFLLKPELSKATELTVIQKMGELQTAQMALMERTQEFTSEELWLQQIMGGTKEDFEVALNGLKVSTSERQDLVGWYASQDFKRISAYSRKRLSQLYKRTAFTRSSWEAFFASQESVELQQDLSRYHQKMSDLSRSQAEQDSRLAGISLKVLKENIQDVQKFCSQIPKGGILHTHPYGTMDRATVKNILTLFDPVVDKVVIQKYLSGTTEKIHAREVQFLNDHALFYEHPKKYSEVVAKYPQDAEKIADFFFVPRDVSLFTDGVTPFSRFLAAFSLPLEMLGILNGNIDNQINLEKIIYTDMFLRNIDQGVSYMEITRNLPNLKTSRQFADRYKELLIWTESVPAIVPRTLLSFNRTTLDSDEKRVLQLSTMSQLLSMPASNYVVGINLMGDEGLVSALDAAQMIYGKLLLENRKRETGLRATIHAGELGDVRNLRDALAFGVERIGHGIKFLDNPLYLELARRQGIALEISLSSNEILQVSSVAKNPFLYFHRLGMSVSLSTDDEGMFLTDPSEECVLAILQTDMEYVELRSMLANSIKTSFADPDLKKVILKKFDEDLSRFEQNWKNVCP
ncbi:MAG: hypothetical protein IT287_10070 [Bdellovibrionaceae bacterium]|nr:hypothetical protein [Pseudobdellovibrionaceae bacterium]